MTSSSRHPSHDLSSSSRKWVILDRDGVINLDCENFIKSPNEWQPIEGSLEAIAQLNQAGHRVAIASNQSGIGRGLFDMATLNAIHAKMHKTAAACGARIDAIFFCPHTAKDNCECRKPKPGMLRNMIDRLNIDPRTTPIIGDAQRDIEAAIALGFSAHLVLTGKGQKTLQAGTLPSNVGIHADLRAFVQYFLSAASDAKTTTF
jgi:D-glycero-D-manno-heptose 1,7-bisphosphate phosphatase